MNGIERAEAFIEKARAQGYEIRDSIFKVDYNGKTYNVGFWIRPARWNRTLDEYELPGLCGKLRHANFEEAVKLLIEKLEAEA